MIRSVNIVNDSLICIKKNIATIIASNLVIALFYTVAPPALAQVEDCKGAGSITANNYSDENYPYNAFDNNTQTRWENPGKGSWIKYRFEYNVTFNSVDIAWYKGNGTSYSFKIQMAGDATADFRTIFSGNSSGSTAGFEHYDFNDTLADRIKIQVYGNNKDTTAAITEIRLNTSSNETGTQGQLNSSSKLSVPEHIVPSWHLPSAADVWHNETFYVPGNVSNFVLLIPNEGHHTTPQEQLSPKNSNYLPTHIIMSKNTALSVLNDDNGHCHITWITTLQGDALIAKTDFIPHAATTNETINFNSSGVFKIADPSAPAIKSTIVIYNSTNAPPAKNVTVGAIYVPQEQLAKFKQMFADAKFTIESEYNFEWQNANNAVKKHTLLIYSTTEPLENALAALSKIAEATPYT